MSCGVGGAKAWLSILSLVECGRRKYRIACCMDKESRKKRAALGEFGVDGDQRWETAQP